MSRDSDKTREALTLELAEIKARLHACQEQLADKQQQESECKATCINEIEQLRQARETLELANLIVENSQTVLFRREATEEAKLVYVSENVSQWGYAARDFLDGTIAFRDIAHPDDIERMRKEIDRYRDLDVEEYAQEYRILTAEGEIRWISDQTVVIRDEEGNKTFNQGVLMDITRRKEAETALSDSEFKFRRTIESAGEGYVLLGEDLRIKEVNDAYCRMLGYDREEMVGKYPQDFATTEYKRFVEANKERFLGQEYRRFEGNMIHRDGRVVPVLINANTLRDAGGDFLGHVAFVADITEQKKGVELAGEVQKSLLPTKAPHVPGLDVAGSSIASEIAGGDYFDYLEGLDPEHPSLTVAVGDISGHGVDAALLMTTARGFLRMRAAQPGSPGQIVTEMNRHLASDLYGSGRFMTMFYLKLDPETNTAHWVRAGHDPAMIYCPVHDSFTVLGDEGSALPLGVTEESRYPEQSNEVHPGQIIAIGTDGIWESRNARGEMFGKERFKEILRAHAGDTAQVILDSVFEAVRVFTGGARADDDITLVVVKYGFTDE